MSATVHSPNRYLLKTLGCKANLYDSQLIESELLKRGWLAAGGSDGDPDHVRLCIVNSCTVTDEADRQSRKLASRLARTHPRARVVMTGCAAEVDPERLAHSKGIHYVVGNQDKPRLVDLILSRLEQSSSDTLTSGAAEILGGVTGYDEIRSRHPIDREWPLPESSFGSDGAVAGMASGGEASRTRAFLKIQEGCNAFCTYCIIPYGRGPSRSLAPERVIEQVREIDSQGIREIVITGTNIGDYGTDFGDALTLEALLRRILTETGIERIRVSSLDPIEITPGILDLVAREPRLCPHFHVSLQSPHSRVLRLMKRKYAWPDVERCLKQIAEIPAPAGGVFVGMDLITGFPGETAEDFDWTLGALENLPWSRLHVFPYSERSGTPATRLDGVVPENERRDRARRLRELSFERIKGIYQKVARENQVLAGILVESEDGAKGWSGYTPNYLRVRLARAQANQIVSARALQILEDPASGEASFLAEISAPSGQQPESSASLYR